MHLSLTYVIIHLQTANDHSTAAVNEQQEQQESTVSPPLVNSAIRLHRPIKMEVDNESVETIIYNASMEVRTALNFNFILFIHYYKYFVPLSTTLLPALTYFFQGFLTFVLIYDYSEVCNETYFFILATE